MRLIDADALMKQIESPYTEYSIMIHLRRAIKDFIDSAPTIDAVSVEDYRSMENTCYKLQKALYEKADAVSVARCKECKHCKKKKGTFKGEPIIFYRCEENNRDVESDDYCSWGERSDT